MTDEESPRPFRRERNLSNRNFRRRGSSRRFSTESHSSVDSFSTSTETESSNTTATNTSLISSSSSSTTTDAFQYSYSVNSDSENAFNQKSLLKIQQGEELRLQRPDSIESAPTTPDPALLGVKQKVLRFETLKAHERIIFKTGKFNSKFNISGSQTLGPLRVLPTIKSSVPDSPTCSTPTASTPDQPSTSTIPRRQISSLYKSIDEARSEDEVDDIACDDVDGETVPAGEYVLSDDIDVVRSADADKARVPHITIDDFGKVETQSNHAAELEGSGAQDVVENSENSSENGVQESKTAVGKKGTKDFPRNYRSTPRPKTQIVGTTNRHLIGKYNSVYQPKDDEEPEEEEEEIELRDKCFKYIHPILEELINTEETYVESLFNGIKNYGNIFARKDLPLGLRGKKYVLLGNIEQIAEFHRDEFLPMLLRNRRDLKRLFDEFQHFVEQNCFYGYVIFTMNKQKSLKLCEDYKTYFKLLQTELDDKLGINSFLVQPIQRIAKYPLLLKEFISTLFKNRDFVMKPIIESCCRLDKKIRTLLTTTNESEVINDIIDCHEFNVFFQGKFRKVSDFNVFDHTLKRSYRGKIFIFDKCIIYTEIKGKSLLFHGRYPCEHIGIVAKTKSFTLFYERRKQQECDFTGDVALIEQWLELIRDMISSYATEERQKLQELYSRESDHMHRKPPSLSLFRDSNRFSSDSGIGNIWVMPKPELGEDALNNRTTWYAVS